MSAANGWPRIVKDTQKMVLPRSLPCADFMRSSGWVRAMSGSWRNMPRKATPADRAVRIGRGGVKRGWGRGGLTDQVVCRHADEELVEYGRDEKDGKAGDPVAPAAGTHRVVDVAAEELVDGLVPGAPVDAEAFAVPFGCVSAKKDMMHSSRGKGEGTYTKHRKTSGHQTW